MAGWMSLTIMVKSSSRLYPAIVHARWFTSKNAEVSGSTKKIASPDKSSIARSILL